jgi:hypothetical protein
MYPKDYIRGEIERENNENKEEENKVFLKYISKYDVIFFPPLLLSFIYL